jgi:hypothetical protein
VLDERGFGGGMGILWCCQLLNGMYGEKATYSPISRGPRVERRGRAVRIVVSSLLCEY